MSESETEKTESANMSDSDAAIMEKEKKESPQK